MQNASLCVECAIKNPGHLEKGLPSHINSDDTAAVEPEIAFVKATQSGNIIGNLEHFTLKPKGKKVKISFLI